MWPPSIANSPSEGSTYFDGSQSSQTNDETLRGFPTPKKKKHSSFIFKISNSFQTECVGEVRGLGRPWRGSWVLIYFVDFFFDRYKVLHPTLPAWFTNHSSHQRRDQMATCFCLPVGICNGTSIATSIREHEIRVIQKVADYTLEN